MMVLELAPLLVPDSGGELGGEMVVVWKDADEDGGDGMGVVEAS